MTAMTATTVKAVVTGHSRGLGAAVAETLRARGVGVLGLSRRTAGAPDIEEAALDLSDPAALAAWLEGGGLGRFLEGASTALLVNNAGTVAPIGPPGVLGAGETARAVTLNVTAPLMLADAFAAATSGMPDRRIVHISSGAGRSAYPGWGVYGATKAALDHHARCVALDALPGLRITSLAPGVIDTDMQADIRATPAERFPNLSRFVGLKRDGGLSAPGDVAARLVDYLLGEGFGADPVTDLRSL
ncbi:MAG TPA: SDR family oxidoreductase [Azospirillaceae bacterium]|nr:SDR family oxidoreductase [Azospirillaceae bacterium]